MAEDAFCVLLTRFMETIHVKLPHKAIHLVMAEEERKNNLLELGDVLDDKILAAGSPVNCLGVLFRLYKNRCYIKNFEGLGDEAGHLELMELIMLAIFSRFHAILQFIFKNKYDLFKLLSHN